MTFYKKISCKELFFVFVIIENQSSILLIYLACMLVDFACMFFNGVPLLTVVAKIEAQSSAEFTACCNNKPGSVVSIDMGGVNRGCINM